jgi:hypothetical protein
MDMFIYGYVYIEISMDIICVAVLRDMFMDIQMGV